MRAVGKLRLATAVRMPRPPDVRRLHASALTLDAPHIPHDASPEASTSSSKPLEPFQDILTQKTEAIRRLLTLSSPSPSRVWATYLELLSFYDRHPPGVPLDVHRGVLRKCAPPPAHTRALAAQTMSRGARSAGTRVFEARLQTVIRNIRAGGHAPALADYHVALAQLAAVGAHASALAVLDEVGRVGLAKEPGTYTLCLQALARRLALPVWHERRAARGAEVAGQCVALVREMGAAGVPYTAENLELVFRILKETMNMDGFRAVMKGAYGIDLAYPDRAPLEYWDARRRAAAAVGEARVPLPARQPFLLPAFNTALDFLGRAGEVSKLVQTFEVITTALPPAASQAFAFDEDDDDFGYADPQVAPYKPPHVRPNTTSFRLLLFWLAKAEHAVLARHYLLVALHEEHKQRRGLHFAVQNLPPEKIYAPSVAVNRGLFLPVFHLANRHNQPELLRFLHTKIRLAIRRKRVDIAFFEAARARWVASGAYEPRTIVNLATMESDLDTDEDISPPPPPSSRFALFFTPSSALPRDNGASASSASTSSADATPAPETETRKLFDIDTHLGILRRDLEELRAFRPRVAETRGRSVQRTKERLGQRVWAAKDVFLRSTGQREVVSREAWREQVRFVPQAEVEARRRPARPREPKRTRRAVPEGSEASAAEPAGRGDARTVE